MLTCNESLASYFSFFFSFFSYFLLHPGYVYLLRVPSSVQQPSATLSKYPGTYFILVVRVLSARVICILPHLEILSSLLI